LIFSFMEVTMHINDVDENKDLNTDDDFEIEVVADEAPAGKVEPPKVETPQGSDTPAVSTTDSDDDDDDDSDYGEKVRKRIAKETWKRREAERQAEAAKQQLAQIQTQLQTTQQRVVTADDAAIQAHEQAVDAEYERVQSAYKRAYDEGDTEAMFKATEALADLRFRKRQVEGWKAQRQQRPAQPQPQPQQPQRPVQPQADPRAMDWATRNTWFGKDPIKTGAAYALDAELKSRGVDPRSDAYYDELDRRLGEAFPDIRAAKPKAERPAPSQPVAGVTSRTTGEKRKVTLTASEVAMAEQLGVPLAEYARYLKRA
jgi:hypothetical protein